MQGPKITTLWLDTEFNGWGGDFISAALVAEDGQSWYQSVGCDNPIPWVSTNVMPHLGIAPISQPALVNSLQGFLMSFEALHIIADWPDDIAYFCRLLSTQTGIAIRTPPLQFELKTWLNGSTVSKVPHNALSDALALMQCDIAETRC